MDAAGILDRVETCSKILRGLAFPAGAVGEDLAASPAALDLLAERLVDHGYEIVPVHRGALKTGQNAFVQLVHLERALAERNAATATQAEDRAEINRLGEELLCVRTELDAARKYAVAWVAVARAWAGGADIDGFTLQEIGLKSGALLETDHDPDLHGEAEREPGDTYYTLPPDARALAPDPETPT